MANLYGIVKVAAVQASSIFLDCEGTTEKACRLVREAGSCARAAGRASKICYGAGCRAARVFAIDPR